ncbi:hypothetical protein [Burkholderia multivorans]|uniref:hypothetical protein n=1 Tax=Burkholderia multivorans TaxID=87883 RepID=UPI000D004716|nr:hypothetical protein [Burkholderia multivorans]MBY4796674.1 hypothetical protein [Burkholderia multivorans]PRE73177.1 hypothetical protein C6P86_03350 [Burkholderia multivorans]PRE85094.1 hypothetical protein C6Q00_15650 [Burkholderia multivorans]PRG13705.1 hypothetical protein C6Q21_03895 [Burkholderia multivorans]
MVSYIHAPLVAICFFILLAMWRFWSCIDRMGFMREVSRRAPSMLHGDLVAGILAFMPFLLALIDWTGITLPRQDGPISPYVAVFLSLGCLLGCMFTLRQSGERFAGHWAGTRESALRTVAALRIIDAAELAHALSVLHQHEALHDPIHVIDAETLEVRK